jgi:hypothetical protein
MNLKIIKGLTLLILFSLVGSVLAQTNEVSKTLSDSFSLIKDENNASAYRLQMSDDSPDQWANMGAIDKAHPAYSYIIQKLGGDMVAKHPIESVHVGLSQMPNKSKKYIAWLYVERLTLPNTKTSNPTISIGIFNLSANNIYVFDHNIRPLIKLPAVRQIFIAPVGFFGSYGGEWNVMDDTRQHIVQELKGTVSVGSIAKSNPPKIIVKARLHSKFLKRTFALSKRRDGSLHYETKDREIFPKVDKYESLDDPY